MEETNMSVPESGTQEAVSPNETATEALNQAVDALVNGPFTYRGRPLVRLSDMDLAALPAETEVLIKSIDGNRWWRAPREGYTSVIGEAHVYTIGTISSHCGPHSIIFRIMPSVGQPATPTPEPTPAPPKSTDEELYELVMSARDLRNFICSNNRQDLWDRECHYRHPLSKEYYTSRDVRREGETTPDVAQAAVTTVRIVLQTMMFNSSEICLLKPQPLPDGKKCLISRVLPKSIIELMMVAPRNEQVRGNLLRIFKQMPPVELDTFEKIRDWIEANCEPPITAPAPVQPRNVPNRNVPELTLEFIEHGTESGRCTYSVQRSGTGTATFTLDELREWIEDGEDVGGIIEKMIYHASDDFNPGNYEYDNYEYGNEESRDFDSDGIEIHTNNPESLIRYFLESNDPDLLEQLDNN